MRICLGITRLLAASRRVCRSTVRPQVPTMGDFPGSPKTHREGPKSYGGAPRRRSVGERLQ